MDIHGYQKILCCNQTVLQCTQKHISYSISLPVVSLHLGVISSFPGNRAPRLLHILPVVAFSRIICSSDSTRSTIIMKQLFHCNVLQQYSFTFPLWLPKVCSMASLYHVVKNFGGKKLGWIRTVRSLVEKNFGELKFICIGNVMEIVKIGKKLSKLL